MHKIAPLKKRFLFKVISNFLGLISSLIFAILIPKTLGPEAFGNFGFLTNFFTNIANFLDSGSSTFFYTRISQRPKEPKLFTSFFYFSMLVMLVILVVPPFAHFFALTKLFWPNQSIRFIYLASIYSGLLYFLTMLDKCIDAYGLTISGEIVRTIQRLMALVILLSLFFTNNLRLTTLFFYNYSIFLILATFIFFILSRNGYLNAQSWKIGYRELVVRLTEMFNYSRHLIVASLVGMIGAIGERWLLEYYSGSTQQGYFSLSLSVSCICTVFMSASVPLLQREFSVAFHSKDTQSMREMFTKYVPFLYSIIAFFSCFIAFEAEKIISIIGKAKFSGALVPVIIMALYPVHQLYGQITGSFLFATDQVKVYRNVSLTITCLGLATTYFILAPVFGINSGAAGLAAKTVILNIFSVNILLCFCVHHLHLPFKKYLIHQVNVVFILASIAYTSSRAVDFFISDATHGPIALLFSGVIYTIIVMIALNFFSEIFGLNRLILASLKKRVSTLFTSPA